MIVSYCCYEKKQSRIKLSRMRFVKSRWIHCINTFITIYSHYASHLYRNKYAVDLLNGSSAGFERRSILYSWIRKLQCCQKILYQCVEITKILKKKQWQIDIFTTMISRYWARLADFIDLLPALFCATKVNSFPFETRMTIWPKP